MQNIALLFSGQGTQYQGMAKELYCSSSVVKETFEEASDAINLDLCKLCFEDSLQNLSQTQNTQPALVTVGVAYFRDYIKKIGIEPKYLAGHSIGELTALACSGAIEFKDAVKIARKRGIFMQEAVPLGMGSMLAITGLDKDEVEEMCIKLSNDSGIVSISNLNSKEQIVVSGNKDKVNELKERVDLLGAKTILLKVSGPFHSKLMKKASYNLEEELKKYKFNDFKYKVCTNLSSLPYKNKDEIVHNLSMQMINPVQWERTIAYLRRQGIDMTVELGPGKVLRNLSKRNIPEIESYSYDITEDRDKLKKELVTNKKSKDFFSKCLAVCVSSKNSNWNNEEYEIGVVENYNKIKNIESDVKENNRNKEDSMKEVLDLVYSILVTKKVEVKEQINKIQDIITETNTEEIFSDFIPTKYNV
ncbi:MAG: ACP S-malonyltransferase [Clostridium sp.]|jgi:[acyl-carrier-protein] S-malonyltransferase|nr:ACP S-malonyltransferase [Clostridium sp.]